MLVLLVLHGPEDSDFWAETVSGDLARLQDFYSLGGS